MNTIIILAVLMVLKGVVIALLINRQTKKLKLIIMNQNQLAADMARVTAQLQKIGTESSATLAKVAELEAVIANQDNVSPELQAAVDALKAQAQVVDDLVPDAAPTPEPAPSPAPEQQA